MKSNHRKIHINHRFILRHTCLDWEKKKYIPKFSYMLILLFVHVLCKKLFPILIRIEIFICFKLHMWLRSCGIFGWLFVGLRERALKLFFHSRIVIFFQASKLCKTKTKVTAIRVHVLWLAKAIKRDSLTYSQAASKQAFVFSSTLWFSHVM